jgi:hypothetical protein
LAQHGREGESAQATHERGNDTSGRGDSAVSVGPPVRERGQGRRCQVANGGGANRSESGKSTVRDGRGQCEKMRGSGQPFYRRPEEGRGGG